MSLSIKATDWQALGVAQVGGAKGVGGLLMMFQFRSRQADFLGEYLFAGAGIGGGGSLNGGVAPSPADVAHNRMPNLWSDIQAVSPFSADDLDLAYAALSFIGVSAMVGYSLVGISAGLIKPLFTSQDVSGWGIGVGLGAGIMVGTWKRLSNKGYS